jgi:hypothetical protein
LVTPKAEIIVTKGKGVLFATLIQAESKIADPTLEGKHLLIPHVTLNSILMGEVSVQENLFPMPGRRGNTMRSRRLLFAFIFTLISTNLLYAQEEKKRLYASHINEAGLRARVLHSLAPEYHQEAIEKNIQGTVLVAVLFSGYGKFLAAEIFDSPDDLLSSAVKKALKKWKIRRHEIGSDGTPVPLVAELRFRFVVRDGVGVIEQVPFEVQNKWSVQFRTKDAGIHYFKEVKDEQLGK